MVSWSIETQAADGTGDVVVSETMIDRKPSVLNVGGSVWATLRICSPGLTRRQ